MNCRPLLAITVSLFAYGTRVFPQEERGGEATATPVIEGRLHDEKGDLLPLQVITWHLSYHGGGSTGWSSRGAETDAEGRFFIELPDEAMTARGLHLEITLPDPSATGEERNLRARRFRMSIEHLRTPGTHDLGNVQVEIPFFARLDTGPVLTDDDLERELLRILTSNPTWGMDSRLLEACLREMIDRGGDRFRDLVREQWTMVRADGEEGRRPYVAIPLLTALRRLEGKADPLGLEVAGTREFVLPFPELPVLKIALRNQDVEGEAVMVSEGGNYRSGRFTRCRIDGHDPQGNPLPVFDPQEVLGGGFYHRGRLPAGVALDFDVPFSSFTRLESPGEHEFRVQYHDEFRIAHRRDVDRLIVVTSDPIRLRWEARTVRISEERERKIFERIAELDGLERVLLVSFPYSEGATPTFRKETPATRILAEGFDAVPVLLAALENSACSAHRRAWILALLFDLTGVLDPRDVPGVIGAFKTEPGWRGGAFISLGTPPWGVPKGGARRTRLRNPTWHPGRPSVR